MKLPPHYFRSHRRAWRVSLGGSACAHLVAGGAGLILALQLGTSGGRPHVSTVAAPSQFEAGWTLKSLIESEEVADRTANEVTRSPEINEAAAGLADMIRDRVNREVEGAEGQRSEELMAKLERLGGRLETVSSPGGVDEVANVLESSLGLTKRNTMPDPQAVEGEFDHATAQIEDVKMSTGDEGVVTYIATMSDAAGRRLEVELDEADGKQLYDTFQLIKRFPLLEQVYRKVIMGLMDKMMQQEGERMRDEG